MIFNKYRYKYLAAVLIGVTCGFAWSAPGVPNPADIPRAGEKTPRPSVRPSPVLKRPAPASNTSSSAVRLHIQKFNISGNQSIKEEELHALLAPYLKKEIGMLELNRAVQKITQHYRKQGYFLAQAYLPTQDIVENTVEVAIIEGQLGVLDLGGVEGFNQAFMKSMAAYRLEENDAVSEHNLVRNVTLLNSLPGTRATAQLNPSENLGATDVEITLEPLPSFQGYIGANTYGNRFTGREVVLAGVRLNNPVGLGDLLSLNLKRSNNNGQRGVDIGYITPVHASGTLLSLGYNYVDYQLGRELETLDASGESQYFNISIDQPLVRDARKGLSVRIGTSYKIINDEVSTAALENRRNILAAEFGLYSDWLNKAGDVSYQLGASLRTGKVMFKDDFAQILDETGAKTKGGFVKYNLTANRTQYFENGANIAFRADYQRAGKNLDSVEKTSIGGTNRWRRFAELPSLADTGFVIGAELRKIIPANKSLASLLLVDISPYGFLDVGRGKINQKPSVNDNHVKSLHFGLGLDATFKSDWLFSVTASHQNRDFEGASAENEVRVWGRLEKHF